MGKLVRSDVCPVCGNDLLINVFATEFRCKYCRRIIAIHNYQKKGKYFISLEEKVGNRPQTPAKEKAKFIHGLEGR